MNKTFLLLLPLALASSPSLAGEIFGGIYAHDVPTPLTKSGIERGAEIHFGVRGARIEALRAIGAPSPHLYGALTTAAGANYAVAGVSWRIGGQVYFRPGIGLAVHDGPVNRRLPGRIDFGSRILFAPEVAAGVQLTERASAELSWVHLSHAQLFSPHNPGMDSFGVRVNYRF
jgi:lipid A 3-O-deacylase